jgi:hypothetical protein
LQHVGRLRGRQASATESPFARKRIATPDTQTTVDSILVLKWAANKKWKAAVIGWDRNAGLPEKLPPRQKNKKGRVFRPSINL